jgi:hypothetical protein
VKKAIFYELFTLGKGILAGILVSLAGLACLLHTVRWWQQVGYGELPHAENWRRWIPAATPLMPGIQTIFPSFLMRVLGPKAITRHPPPQFKLLRRETFRLGLNNPLCF